MSKTARNRIYAYLSSEKQAEKNIYDYLQKSSKLGIGSQSQIIKEALELYIKSHPFCLPNQNIPPYRENSIIKSESGRKAYNRSETEYPEKRKEYNYKQNIGFKKVEEISDIEKNEDKSERIKATNVQEEKKASELEKERDDTFVENKQIKNNDMKSKSEENNPFIKNILKGMDDLRKASH